MLPLNNELESCWCQKLTELIKIILHPKFERKRIKGRCLWNFELSTKEYHLYWPPCWRAYSCPPKWRPELLFAYILLTFDSYAQMCCKRSHINFLTFILKFKCKICVQKEVIHNFNNHIHIIVFWRKNHLTFIFIKTMSHDLLVQMPYSSTESKVRTTY